VSNIDALQRAREAAAAKRAAGELVQLSPAEKAAKNPTSRSLALAAKCFDCVNGPNADGGYRRAIRECPSTKCALHNFRPYQARADTDIAEAA
jgi:hypothetical protein